LELLNLVIDQTPTASLLTVLTCRPHFHPAWHHRSYLTEMTVNRLSQPQIARMTTDLAGGKPLPGQVLAQITAKTDGVPLFVEELTKAVLELGVLQEVDGQYVLTGTLSSFAIPATLQDSLMARLDRLVTAKGVAQYAAVIGRQFTYDVLSTVSQLDDTTLQRELGRLVDVEMVYQRGVPPQATYAFKHALIQDAAYASLLKSTRQQYHQRIAQVLEAQFPATAETQPELLAHHATEAGLTAQAVPYWHRAGQRASERSAHVEAIAHLRQGLALLETLPETSERTQGEVDMLIALGASLRATQGFAAPEVGQTYARARQLCTGLEEPHQLFSVLRGLHGYYSEHAELQLAHELGARLLTLAQQVQDPVMLSVAHRTLGTTLFYVGAPAEASTHLSQSMALSAPQQHHPSAFFYGEGTSVISLSRTAWVRWYLGYPDQGLTQSQEAVALAQQIAHPFSLSLALSYVVMLHQCRREVGATQERAEAAISLATAQGFPQWRAHGAILRGWALTQQGSAQEGMAQMTQGVIAYRATGAEILRPYCLALLAEVHGTLGQLAAGLRVLTEALRLADTTGARWYKAELYRLKGVLLLQQHADNHLETETCFHHALDVARRQEARSLELRAAMSLSRLWQQQGKRTEAHDLLAEVYGWFTEGFNTADLQEAKVLLDELGG
jgi:predicted ATPase